MDFTYILAGATVGFIVGLTGVGGGSLMTPILVLGFHIQPTIAVGTDLLYAAITKTGGMWTHHRLNNINWKIVKGLSLGSIPGSISTIVLVQYFSISGHDFEKIISLTLGVMLIFTALVIIFKKQINLLTQSKDRAEPKQTTLILLGLTLGVLVTISSVGAGAIGGALLLLLYPNLKARTIIGTDIAHAVPLTAVAGLGHLQLGHIDFQLLLSLIIGSLPAIYLGAIIGEKIHEDLLKTLVALILLVIGLKFII